MTSTQSTNARALALEELVLQPYQTVMQELGSNSSEGTYQDAVSDIMETMERGMARAAQEIMGMRATMLTPLLQSAATTGRGNVDPTFLMTSFKQVIHRRVHCWLQDVGRIGRPGSYTINERLTIPGGYLHTTMKRNLRHAIVSHGEVARWSVDPASYLRADGEYLIAFAATMFGLSGKYQFTGNILND